MTAHDDAAPVSPAPVRLVLLGLMGSGKSTVGRQVANVLGWPYLDNDELLTDLTGRTLTQLGEQGRGVLHAAERDVLTGILDRAPPLVASAAAAVIEDATVRARLADRAFAVYLHVPVEELVRRIGDDPHRPWLRPDPEAALSAFHTARDPLYRSVAALVVDASGPPERSVATVIAALPRAT